MIIFLQIIDTLTMVEIQLQSKINNNEQILNYLKENFQNSNNQYKIGIYRFLAQLGEGAFGKVFKGVDTETARPVAIKIINIDKLMAKYTSHDIQKKLRRYLRDEELLMKKCHSAFVVKLYQTFENTKCKVLVMEYCRHGALDNFISEKTALEEEDAVIILRQLILGLSELHRNGIIHRDLKPANILIHNGIFKIGDFGLSKQLIEANPQSYINEDPTVAGSHNTMAPEVKNREIYGLKADIWSLGMIYFMMVYPKNNLNKRHQDAIKFFMFNGDFHFRTITDRPLSDHSVDFLKSTLINENARMNWEQTLEHPLFKTRFQRMPSVYLPGLDEAFDDLKDKKEKLDDKKVLEVQKGIIDFEKLKAQSEKMLAESIKQDQLLQHLDVDLLNQQYLECRISEYIYYEIINPILTKNMLSNKRFHVQFLFLLLNRCRENIICAKDVVNTKYPEEVAQQFCKQVKQLSDVVQKKFDEIVITLKAIEDKFSQIIKDKISRLFYRQCYKEKEKFLNCFERQQFIKEEQLGYTYKEYIPRIVNEIKGESIQEEEKMKGLIKSYKEINQIKLANLGSKRIQQEIQSIINKNL